MKHTSTQISLHSVKNILGDQSQLSLFADQANEFSNEYNIALNGTIDRLGVDLTDMESRVMEAILRGFSEARYHENLESMERESICNEKFAGKIPPAYRDVPRIPFLKITQAQILEWCGVGRNCIATKTRVVQALRDLGSKQYCFYYDRLVYDKDGLPVKDKNKKWVKEEIYTVDTLFTIKEVRNQDRLVHYEIFPSVIFLDQRESYFMFVPFNWREEVCELVGQKKASSYTFRFLLYLRYQHELFRRRKQSAPYILKRSKEEVAIAIKMPESVYRRKAGRMDAILSSAYEVALKLGYLSDYKRGESEIFVLNDKKFFSAHEIEMGHSEKHVVAIAEECVDLFNFFHNTRKSVDPHHKIPLPSDVDGYRQLQEFRSLLTERTSEEIKTIVAWSSKQKYWSSHTTMPKDLIKNFEKLVAEFKTSSATLSKEERIERNKSYVLGIVGHYEGRALNKTGVRVDVLSKEVQIVCGTNVLVIPLEKPRFQEEFAAATKQWNIHELLYGPRAL